MKILIIGGTGLISNSISRELLEKGADLTLYNRGKSEMRFPAGAKTILGDRKERRISISASNPGNRDSSPLCSSE